MSTEWKEQEKDIIFALDIGTRSIIGILGKVEEDRIKVLAIEKKEHGKRTMLDGQIDDIEQVSQIAKLVTERLEAKMGMRLRRVCVAAAGRTLRTERGRFELHLPDVQRIDTEIIGQLEMGAVLEAETCLPQKEADRSFYLVGYTVIQYQLDHYPMTSLEGHSGQNLEAEVVATFLPSEVVESLYAAMESAKLEIVSLTLEPIAALNAAIPADLRLLNLALADIGAGTSDIAVCQDGSVVGYTMATMAGDEITEVLMKAFLVEFQTAEKMKLSMIREEIITYTDILGLEHQVTQQEIQKIVQEPTELLAKEIATRMLELNQESPSAVFLAGGGSQLYGLCQRLAEYLEMDPKRIAIAGSNFEKSAFSEVCDLKNPEYATPLGIIISAGLGLINDSYRVMLNGQSAKLFRSGALTVRDILLMNGYSYADMLGRTGQNLIVTWNGKRTVFYGKAATPCLLELNGVEAFPTARIHAGDQITFTPAQNGEPAHKTVRELVGESFSGEVFVNGETVSFDSPLCTGDVILSVWDTDPMENELDWEMFEGENPITEGTEKQYEFILNDKPLVLTAKADGTPYYLMDLLNYSGIDFEQLTQPVMLQVNGQDAYFLKEIKDNDVISIRYESSN